MTTATTDPSAGKAACGFAAVSATGAPVAPPIAASTSASLSARYATGVFTATVSPSGTTIRARRPATSDSTSMVALSVSTSKMTCPILMTSPTWAIHLTILPSSID
ncbi:MAG: hypothetical protein NT031_10085 [Planctomycetota bacterium]|nr:hypothetical protein [Planctomycetota bacterium]